MPIVHASSPFILRPPSRPVRYNRPTAHRPRGMGALPPDYVAPGNPFPPGSPQYASFNASAIVASEGGYGSASSNYFQAFTEPPQYAGGGNLPPQPRSYSPPTPQFVTITDFTGTYAVATLESQLQQLLAEDTANPGAVGRTGAGAAAQNYTEFAKQHCALYPGDPQCASLSQLAAVYAQKMLDFMKTEADFQAAAGLTPSLPPFAPPPPTMKPPVALPPAPAAAAPPQPVAQSNAPAPAAVPSPAGSKTAQSNAPGAFAAALLPSEWGHLVTDSTVISSVPNWALGLGALAAIVLLPKLLGGR